MIDMDKATFDAVLNRPTEQRYSLHALFNF
jgi:hypothetical protein